VFRSEVSCSTKGVVFLATTISSGSILRAFRVPYHNIVNMYAALSLKAGITQPEKGRWDGGC
jgi:hypothetical protein